MVLRLLRGWRLGFGFSATTNKVVDRFQEAAQHLTCWFGVVGERQDRSADDPSSERLLRGHEAGKRGTVDLNLKF